MLSTCVVSLQDSASSFHCETQILNLGHQAWWQVPPTGYLATMGIIFWSSSLAEIFFLCVCLCTCVCSYWAACSTFIKLSRLGWLFTEPRDLYVSPSFPALRSEACTTTPSFFTLVLEIKSRSSCLQSTYINWSIYPHWMVISVQDNSISILWKCLTPVDN